MKISSEILIDLVSSSQEDSYLDFNLERLVHLLHCSIGGISHAYEPKLTFTREGEGEGKFRCWIEASKGLFLEPQMPTILTDGVLDPYRSAACLIMVQFFNWNKDYPTTGESLEIPILFR